MLSSALPRGEGLLAINKRKLLASAQKHLQRGALDKALRDYQALAEADPRDTNVRLKIGDIHLRRGEREQAIATYLRVAEQFMRDGFDAKAVAIYKQITKLDPKRYEVYPPLAELYQRLGLVGEALAALRTAADGFHREGRQRDALDALRRMAQLDPSNTTSRLKIAELLRQAGLDDEAFAEYEEAASELERQGDWEGRMSVLERMLEIRPDHIASLEAIARLMLEHDQSERAEAFARRLLEVDRSRPESFELLARVLRALGREDAMVQVYRELAELFATRGDEERARDILQRYAPPEPLDLGGEEPDEGAASPGRADAEPPRLEIDPDAAALDLGEERASAPAREAPRSETDAEPELLQGTPEELLAEAGVYLRYGRSERAVALLEALLARDPDHEEALEKLAEAKVLAGAKEEAAAIFDRLAERAGTVGNGARRDRMRARARAARDVGEASEEGADARAGAPGEARAEGDADSIGVQQGGGEGVPAQAEEDLPLPASSAEPAGGSTQETLDIPGPDLDEIEIDLDAGTLDLEEEVGRGGGESASDGQASGEQEEPGAELPSPKAREDRSGSEERQAAAEETRRVGATDTTPQQILEDLEEGNFYYEQGLYEEAEAAYRRVLAAAPQHPQALLRVGEIAVALGRDPGDTATLGPLPPGVQSREGEGKDAAAGAQAPSASESVQRGEEEGSLDEGIEIDLGIDESDLGIAGPSRASVEEVSSGGSEDGAGAAVPGASEPPQVPVCEPRADDEASPPAEAAEIDLSGPLESTDGEGPAAEATQAGEARQPGLRGRDDLEPAEVPPGTEGFQVAGSEARSGDTEPQAKEEGFDLAAELNEAFSDRSETGEGSVARASEEGSFEAVFREFKRGVSRALGEGDPESRYDLGIAYREMGLLDDAIGEFRLAMASPARRVDALHMMALCALDLERPQDAIGHLEQALAEGEVPAQQRVALDYDLGRAYEAVGDAERALDAYRRVAARDPDFCDVAARLAPLERATARLEGDGAAGESETYESFDDLLIDPGELRGEGDERAPAGEARHEESRAGEGQAGVSGPLREAAPAAAAHDAVAAEASVAEAQAGSEPATTELEVEPEAEAPRQPEAPDAAADSGGDEAPSTPSRRRRRRISFV